MVFDQIGYGVINYGLAVFMKVVGHIRHFQWLGPNVWWEISQIFIKPIGQMSHESWKFFGYTGLEFNYNGWVYFHLFRISVGPDWPLSVKNKIRSSIQGTIKTKLNVLNFCAQVHYWYFQFTLTQWSLRHQKSGSAFIEALTGSMLICMSMFCSCYQRHEAWSSLV